MKLISHIALSTAVVVLSAGTAAAGDSSPAYNFLNVPSSVTSYGLGGLNISTVNDDVNNIDMNPALLGPEMEKSIGLNYMYYIGKSNFAGAKFANGINDRSAYAVGIQYFGYGSIRGADAEGNLTGNFSPKDVAFSGYYAHDIGGYWRGGAALKFLYSAYDEYSAFAIATDLAVNYYNPDKDLSFSFVVANLGGQVKRFTDSYDRLPIDVRLGWTQSFGSLPVRFSITAWNLTKWNLPYYEAGDGTQDPELKKTFASNLFRHLIFGVDFVPSSNLSITLGYNYKTRTDMSAYQRSFLSGFTIGASLKVKMFGIGIAFAQPHSGASTFMFNLSTSINDFLR
ncbi:putative uncharacterized protein [Prevotella sp. CAG:1031]|nr:type IX secretion system protein PorQ [Prevotella sp.]CCX43758.1 putative uncharacterized protein [Prevotella sp. CAG:1031]